MKDTVFTMRISKNGKERLSELSRSLEFDNVTKLVLYSVNDFLRRNINDDFRPIE